MSYIRHQPRESALRSLIKAVAYRIVSMTTTGITAGIVFGSWEIAGGFALLDAVCNTGLYYVYERIWSHIDLRSPEERLRDRRATLVRILRETKRAELRRCLEAARSAP